jgi:hypothetical protein
MEGGVYITTPANADMLERQSRDKVKATPKDLP